jgi:putative toxin-antitoxin system antitoxin component (TIGR02293 family)
MLEKSATFSAVHDEADWAARISHITARSQQAFARRPGYSGQWLCTPNPGLDGDTPLEALSTDAGFEAVKGLLTKIEQGIYT